MRGLLIFAALMFAQALTANSAPIHNAAKKGDIAALTAALDGGADVNKASQGATPLYLAAIRGHMDAVKLLIARGADVNAQGKLGSPLMAAAARGSPELVKLFLASGANPNADLESQTALHAAAERGCLACVQVLVEAGANINAPHISGSGNLTLVRTPLHLAVVSGHSDIADFLISHGVIFPTPSSIADKLATADTNKGREFFEINCHGCHSAKADNSIRSGPHLWTIVGRNKAASVDYKGYSKAMLAADGAWTYEELNAFLSGPTATHPGVKMEVQGAPNETDRINLIAYLRTLSDDPVPLP